MNRIKEVLEEKGIKQTWLAEKLGKSYNIVNGYVQNRQQPRLETLNEIANDYVLLEKDGKPLAFAKAKKSSIDASLDREQSKQYCYNIQKKIGSELFFCFYTKGYETFFWDLKNYSPKKVRGFQTKEVLERYNYVRKARKPVSGELNNTKIAWLDYQNRPMRAVDLFSQVYYHHRAQFEKYIKDILGIQILERFPETVSKSFGQYISDNSYLSGRKIQFLDLLRNFIFEKGKIDKPNGIESPFTMINPEGIRGVFSTKEIKEKLVLTEKLFAA